MPTITKVLNVNYKAYDNKNNDNDKDDYFM